MRWRSGNEEDKEKRKENTVYKAEKTKFWESVS